MRGKDQNKALAAFLDRNPSKRTSVRRFAAKLGLAESTTRRYLKRQDATTTPRGLWTAQWRADAIKSLHHFQKTKTLPLTEARMKKRRFVNRVWPVDVHQRLTQLYARRKNTPQVPTLRAVRKFLSNVDKKLLRVEGYKRPVQ